MVRLRAFIFDFYFTSYIVTDHIYWMSPVKYHLRKLSKQISHISKIPTAIARKPLLIGIKSQSNVE